MSRRMQRYLRASDGGSVLFVRFVFVSFASFILRFDLLFRDIRYFLIFFGVDIRSFY